MAVVVFGSINMDLVVRTPRLPVAGETLAAHSFFTAGGGKGANQAVASARAGAPTRMVGRVGDDLFGATLRNDLAADGVDVGGILADAKQPSGVALIAVDDSAENRIMIVAGANGAVGRDDLRRLDGVLEGARVLLLQLEIPMESVVAAARAARERGVTVIVDPAPARPLPPELYATTDLLTPNATEAAMLVGFEINSQSEVEKAARILLERGVRGVIIKLGERGAYWTDGHAHKLLPAFKVAAIDTVAAGDAFNGALAAALAEGQAIEEALRWGIAGGALAVTRAGAQPALPSRSELLQMLGKEG